MKKVLIISLTFMLMVSAIMPIFVTASNRRYLTGRDIPCSLLFEEMADMAAHAAGLDSARMRRNQAIPRTAAAKVMRLSTTFAPRNLRGIEHLTSLRRLDLTIAFLVTNDLRRLERLPRLRDLRMRFFALTYDYRGSGFQDRKEYELGHPAVTVSPIRSLRGVRNLRNLIRLEFTTHTRNIKHLDGDGVYELTGNLRSLRGIENLTNLRVLNVSGNRLTNLNELRSLRNLTHINASNNRLTDASAVGRLPNLRRVNLSHNNLRRIPNLTRRNLTTNTPNNFGNDFRNNRLSRTQFNTKLPARIRRMQNGRWLQRQIESQNLD